MPAQDNRSIDSNELSNSHLIHLPRPDRYQKAGKVRSPIHFPSPQIKYPRRFNPQKAHKKNSIDVVVCGGHRLGCYQFMILCIMCIFAIGFGYSDHKYKIIDMPLSYYCADPKTVQNYCSANCKRVEHTRLYFRETISSEFGLNCSSTAADFYKNSLLLEYTFSMVLISVSCVFMNRYGRRPTFIILVIFLVACNCLIFFSTNVYAVFIPLMFHTGLTFSIHIINFVILIEINHRRFLAIIFGILFICISLGGFLLIGIAYWLREWRLTLSITLIFSGLYILSLFLVTETPHWLFFKGRLEPAIAIATYIAKINRKPTHSIRENLEKGYRFTRQRPKTTRRFLDVFYYPGMRHVLSVMCFCFLLYGMMWHCATQKVAMISDNPFVSCLCLETAKIIGVFLFFALSPCVSRRQFQIYSFLICCPLYILISLLITDRNFQAGTYFRLMSYVMLAIITINTSLLIMECFPSNMFAVALSVNGFFMFLGRFLCQLLVQIEFKTAWLPTALIGFLCFFCSLSCIDLPNLNSKENPTNIHESEQLIVKELKARQMYI